MSKKTTKISQRAQQQDQQQKQQQEQQQEQPQSHTNSKQEAVAQMAGEQQMRPPQQQPPLEELPVQQINKRAIDTSSGHLKRARLNLPAEEQVNEAVSTQNQQQARSLATKSKQACELKRQTAAANICAACKRPIKERYLLMALDKQWHEDCLKCACCDCRLGEVGSSLFTHSDKILCRRDFLRIFGQHGNCAACKKSIPPYELVMRANQNAYHMDCFACHQCQYRFCVGDRFHLSETHKIICTLCNSEQQQQQQPHNHHHLTQNSAHISSGDAIESGVGRGNHLATADLQQSAIKQHKQQQQQVLAVVETNQEDSAAAAAGEEEGEDSAGVTKARLECQQQQQQQQQTTATPPPTACAM